MQNQILISTYAHKSYVLFIMHALADRKCTRCSGVILSKSLILDVPCVHKAVQECAYGEGLKIKGRGIRCVFEMLAGWL